MGGGGALLLGAGFHREPGGRGLDTKARSGIGGGVILVGQPSW